MAVLLPIGSRIAVIAPASRFVPERLDPGIGLLREWGYTPEVFDGVLDPIRNFAASDAVRLEHLVRAFQDPRYDAIWAIRGGYGVTRFIDDIPWDTLTAKVLLGFSDLTPLLDVATRKLGASCVHAPVIHSLPSNDASSLAWLNAVLLGSPRRPLRGDVWVSGTATGPLVGGNLCMLATCCGTASQLDATGCILVLEDVGEPAYRIDRMLQQLSSSGVLNGVAGIALGTFTGCAAPDGQGWDIDDVLRDHLTGLDVPVLAGLPIGHGAANHAFVVRSRGVINDGTLSIGVSDGSEVA
ncbi:MAG: muramoyltetrapeptide carboxypeptidase [Myxococcota bacterium]|jgi:muramoyltetrapeptide carboxypeptidase